MLPHDGEDGSPPTPLPQTDVAGDLVSPSAPLVGALPSVSPAVEAVGEIANAASKLLSPSIHLSENLPSANTVQSDNNIHSLIATLLINVGDPDCHKTMTCSFARLELVVPGVELSNVC